MDNYIIEKPHTTISNRKNVDTLITIQNKSNLIIDLNEPSKSQNPWIISLNEISGEININLLSNRNQNIIGYLNGSTDSIFNINVPRNVKKLNIIMISENIDKNENIKINISLNDGCVLKFAILANNKNNVKQLNIIIKHNGRNIYSDIKAFGINGGGFLRVRANTIIKNDFGGCRQSLKIINLQENVKSECDPVLTIKNNNVDYASHAATISGFDKDHLFYLQAKGIPLAQSKKLLLESFVRDLICILKNKRVENFIASQFMFKAF